MTNSNENADENSDGTFLLAIANENGDIIKKIKKLYWQFHQHGSIDDVSFCQWIADENSIGDFKMKLHLTVLSPISSSLNWNS